MKLILKQFNDEGKLIKEELCKNKTEGLEKIKGMKYYEFHKCYHDEIPVKPCKLIKKKYISVLKVGDHEKQNTENKKV